MRKMRLHTRRKENYASPMPSKIHTEKYKNFLKLIQAAKDGEFDMIMINHPWVLGDDYDEVMENLRLIAVAGVSLFINSDDDDDDVKERV